MPPSPPTRLLTTGAQSVRVHIWMPSLVRLLSATVMHRATYTMGVRGCSSGSSIGGSSMAGSGTRVTVTRNWDGAKRGTQTQPLGASMAYLALPANKMDRTPNTFYQRGATEVVYWTGKRLMKCPVLPYKTADRIPNTFYTRKGTEEVVYWTGKALQCRHNRRPNTCKECGGSQVCEHNRKRSQCKDCGGASICEHNRRRSRCRDCNGASICEHNRERSRCKECGGASICKHNRQRSRCKECYQCPICSRKRPQNVAFNCEHMVCTKCAPELSKCPLCRANITSSRMVKQ
jgi:hypothetical protein